MASEDSQSYNVIGLMSGTSLDGLDIVAVTLNLEYKKWNFDIHHAETHPYSEQWKNKLKEAESLSGRMLQYLHHEYGVWIGNTVKDFVNRHHFIPELVSSHGHTIFHEPEKRMTFQLGNGYSIAAVTGIPTAWDFRSFDIAMGGQGAPLVPIGDALLFGEYDACINLGGFANISFDENGKRIAYDPCPVNLAMQHIVEPLGMAYDKDGAMGQGGSIHQSLLKRLNQLHYYHQSPPKSLGREWLDTIFLPVVDQYDISPGDKLRTLYEHIAMQIAAALKPVMGENVLLSGGGARNIFLVERIQKGTPFQIVLPEQHIVDYKEAIIFALLGVLKLINQVNCYASVTGATEDLSSGNIVLFNR